MDQEKLIRFATNSASDKEETGEVIDWIEESEEHQQEFNRIKNLWSYSGFLNFDELVRNDQMQDPKKTRQGKTISLKILPYAAALILAFVVGGFSFYFLKDSLFKPEFAFNEIRVPLGQNTEVILADQTHIWLNSGATLSYPSAFENKVREVRLSGEAYMEVHHDEERPFHVVTSDLTVNVLGTSFNIEAWKNSGTINVTLVKGKINLQDNEGKLMAVLSPNENATYSTKEKRLGISKVNTTFYTSWKEGTIVFRNEKLGDISQKLERWFNVKIVFEDESVKELRFTGSILRNKPIDQIMEILKYTSNVGYSIDVKEQEPNIIHLKKLPM